MDILELMDEKVIACHACPLRKQCRQPLPPIFSSETTELIVVADRPNLEEESLSWGWGSRENRYVSSLIERSWPQELIHYTYLTKCFSSHTILGKKNTETCRTLFLENELALLKPEKILFLGSAGAKIYKGKFAQIIGEKGFWWSSKYVLDAGKAHEVEFLKFLNKLKVGSPHTPCNKEING